MSVAVEETIIRAQATAIDSLLEISKVYLESAERLAGLNAAAMREAIADAATVVGALGGKVPSSADVRSIQAEVTGPMIDRALSYTRSVQELAAQAQGEIVQLMRTCFTVPDPKMAMPGSWHELIAMFAAPAASPLPVAGKKAASKAA